MGQTEIPEEMTPAALDLLVNRLKDPARVKSRELGHAAGILAMTELAKKELKQPEMQRIIKLEEARRQVERFGEGIIPALLEKLGGNVTREDLMPK